MHQIEYHDNYYTIDHDEIIALKDHSHAALQVTYPFVGVKW